MAKENQNKLALPLEIRKQLEVMDSDISKARNAIDTLRKVGVDVSAISDKLEWAEKVRETLLSEFK